MSKHRNGAEPFTGLLTALAAIEERLDALRGAFAESAGLTVNDTRVLTALVAAGGTMRSSDIGALLDIGSGTLTAMVDRLQQAQLVVRVPNDSDRRSTLVQVTDYGDWTVATSRVYLVGEMCEALDPSIIAETAANLHRLTDRLADSYDAFVRWTQALPAPRRTGEKEDSGISSPEKLPHVDTE